MSRPTVALREPGELALGRHSDVKREVYGERCKDQEGNRHKVIVWRDWSGTSLTSYTLDDGTPFHYEDDCYFLVELTGTMLTRCDD